MHVLILDGRSNFLSTRLTCIRLCNFFSLEMLTETRDPRTNQVTKRQNMPKQSSATCDITYGGIPVSTEQPSSLCEGCLTYEPSCEKTNNLVSDQVRLKPVCTAIEES